VGAHISARALPLHHDIQAVQRSGWRAVDHALNDGEDYELLFTASPGAPMGDDVWPIGYMTSDPRIILEDEHGTIDLEPKGWEHTL